jgi:hypothetical protein
VFSDLRLGAAPRVDGTADVVRLGAGPAGQSSFVRTKVSSTTADEKAKVLRPRRSDTTLVADFGARRVEFSHR